MLDAKSKGRIIAGIRRAFLYSPLRKEVKAKAEVKKDKFRCRSCRKLFGRKEVAVDHIKPVVDPKEGFPTVYILADDDARFDENVEVLDFTRYIYAMFCHKKFIQVLCHPCHKKKTAKERKVSYARRKKEKALEKSGDSASKRLPKSNEHRSRRSKKKAGTRRK